MRCSYRVTKAAVTDKFKLRNIKKKLSNLYFYFFHFTCLSVGEYTRVISLECVIKYIVPKALEDLFLSGKLGVPGIHRIEAMVECEALGLFPAESEKINGLY